MTYKNWIFERDGKIGIIKMNRPDVRNSLNWETWMEFEDILKRLQEEPDLRVGIITGIGDEAFIAGADLRMLKDRTPQDAIDASRKANEILLFMEAMKEPMIAAINGWALGGGCEIALACDIRIASEKAQIGQTEVRVGIMPGYGGNVRLMRLIGSGRAKEMIFTGRVVNAQEAERIGLVNRVVPHERLMEEAVALAKQIAAGPASIHFAKQSMFQAAQHPFKEALKQDSEIYGEVYKTKDFKEGVTAFLEKRKPVFKNQ
ncbi:MAG TPA: enoyl-CoA hydratase-related protein [Thermodesulfobacteriota bacterium]|nr:enoyl-CoA hydratase-related protein [Thermodesulfobacteriota bacterium]